MTPLQKVEFDLLQCFISICEELGLKYYLVCGSALGAVKYGGFIPWDDDIDVGMPRKDYELFLQKASMILPEYYFLQNTYSEPGYPIIFSKLRDSRTTYIEKSAAKLPIHHGVYIDIFPLDGYPKEKRKQRRLERKKTLYGLQAYGVFQLKRKLPARAITWFFKILGYQKRIPRTITKYTKMISSYSIEESLLICNHGNWQGRLEYASKEQYGEGIFLSFEGLAVRIPEKYDEYLTQKYGDWRAELPKEEQVGHHYYSVCDLEKPYTNYL